MPNSNAPRPASARLVAQRIRDGMYDVDLELIQEAIRARRNAIDNHTPRRLYRFTSVRPQYITGELVEFVQENRTQLTVRFLRDTGRFRAGQEVRVPASCLQRVGSDAEQERPPRPLSGRRTRQAAQRHWRSATATNRNGGALPVNPDIEEGEA